jgi:hypothetical protein
MEALTWTLRITLVAKCVTLVCGHVTTLGTVGWEFNEPPFLTPGTVFRGFLRAEKTRTLQIEWHEEIQTCR